jgi:hypothetical protein
LLGPAGMGVEGDMQCIGGRSWMCASHTVVIDSVQGVLFLHWLIVIHVF